MCSSYEVELAGTRNTQEARIVKGIAKGLGKVPLESFRLNLSNGTTHKSWLSTPLLLSMEVLEDLNE